MKTRPHQVLGGLLVAAVLATALTVGSASAQTSATAAPAAAPAATTTLPHWTYGGKEGPKHWGELGPADSACSHGSYQTPIDIRKATPAKLPKIRFNYVDDTVSEINNGHTIEAIAAEGDSITVGDEAFSLVQMHFHAPSEHTVNGKPYAAEFHLVHKTAEGKLAVIGVFIERGKKANPAYDTFIAGSTLSNDATQSESIDWLSILPIDKTTYRYQGSLTTPPCSEGVSWFVMKNPVQLSAAQIKAITAAYSGNNRPLNPLNGRTVNLVRQK